VFLADKAMAARIVDLLETAADDRILEVGSGRGTLTELLAVSGARVISFELDRELIEALNKKFTDIPNVKIINRDFLEVDPGDYIDGRFKLIGNIPYDITSPLIDWLMRYRSRLVRAVITVQREVGNRIVASSGSRNRAPLSIFCQCLFEVRSVITIPPKAFYPPPRIYSSTLVFEPADKCTIDDWPYFRDIVRRAFTWRRKKLINNLVRPGTIDRTGLERILDRLDLSSDIRAEQLSIEDFIRLADNLKAAEKS